MITVICVGKERLDYIGPLIDEYKKRLSAWTRLEWKFIPPSGTNGDEARKTESDRILEKISSMNSIVWLLDELGQELTTVTLAKKLEAMNANSLNLVLIIGGAFGVNEELRQRADFIWSFSKLTLPHQLVRVLLVEQLYRAYSINKGGRYHHA